MTRRTRAALPLLALALASAPAGLAADPQARNEPPAKTVQTTKARSEPLYDRYSIGDVAIEKTGEAARESTRRVIVNFGTNDCEPCRVVNDALYEQPFFKAFIEQFIPVFVDVSPGSVNEPLLARYGVDPSKGLPAIVISAKDLRVAEVTKNGEMAAIASRGKEAVQQFFLARFLPTEEK